jgi:hypothetical protein
MCSVHKVQMPLPGCCMSARTLMRNYGATNVEPTQTDKPLHSLKRRPRQTHKGSWQKHKLGHGS